jgi:hypothetical protein
LGLIKLKKTKRGAKESICSKCRSQRDSEKLGIYNPFSQEGEARTVSLQPVRMLRKKMAILKMRKLRENINSKGNE